MYLYLLALVGVAVSGLQIQSHQGLQGQVNSMDEYQGLDWLIKSIPGKPGKDYPIYAKVPETKFECNGRAEGGDRLSNCILVLYWHKCNCLALSLIKMELDFCWGLHTTLAG